MAIDISQDSADISDSPDKQAFDEDADIMDSQGNDRIQTEEDKNDLAMKQGRNRGRSQVTVHLSNHYNNNQKKSKELSHQSLKRQKTRMEGKDNDEEVDDNFDYDEFYAHKEEV